MTSWIGSKFFFDPIDRLESPTRSAQTGLDTLSSCHATRSDPERIRSRLELQVLSWQLIDLFRHRAVEVPTSIDVCAIKESDELLVSFYDAECSETRLKLYRRSRTRRSRISDRVADSVIPSSRSMKTGSRQSLRRDTLASAHRLDLVSTRRGSACATLFRCQDSGVLVVSPDTETLGSFIHVLCPESRTTVAVLSRPARHN